MKNIVLIGFMATGKTTVGKIISNKLDFSFVDTDELIQQKCNLGIPEIFAVHGQEYFRKIESEVIKDVSRCDSHVISCGGGVVKNPENISCLKKTGVLVCLRASIDAICNRTNCSNQVRPLLYNKSREEIATLMAERGKYYDAQYTVDTTDISPEAAADMVIEYYRNETGFDFYFPNG